MSAIERSRPAPRVQLIRFARPQARNALSCALLQELAAALAGAAADEDVRCVILTGDDRAFSAGADIKEMSDGAIPMSGQAERLRSWKTIERFPKPRIAEAIIEQDILISFEKPVDESLSLERKLLLWQTEDHREGIAAFVEKRKPVFQGR